LLLLMLSRSKSSRPFQSIPVLFAFTAVCCLILRCITAMRGPYTPLMLFSTHLRIDSLFFGVLLSYWYHYHPEFFSGWKTRRRVALALLGTVLLLPAFAFEL